MNALDIHLYGQKFFLDTLDGLPEGKVIEKSGVCGEWSAKDVVSHVTMYEAMLAEILEDFIAKKDTPPSFMTQKKSFAEVCDAEVKKRRKLTFSKILSELETSYKKNLKLLKSIPKTRLEKVGEITWYGKEYSLDDLIVYMYYGHKREHGAQIDVFKTHTA